MRRLWWPFVQEVSGDTKSLSHLSVPPLRSRFRQRLIRKYNNVYTPWWPPVLSISSVGTFPHEPAMSVPLSGGTNRPTQALSVCISQSVREHMRVCVMSLNSLRLVLFSTIHISSEKGCGISHVARKCNRCSPFEFAIPKTNFNPLMGPHSYVFRRKILWSKKGICWWDYRKLRWNNSVQSIYTPTAFL